MTVVLSQLRDEISDLFCGRSEAVSKLSKRMKSLIFTGGSFAAGAAQFMATGFSPSTGPQWVGLIATIIIFVYSFFSIHFDEEASLALSAAQKVIVEAESARESAANSINLLKELQGEYNAFADLLTAQTAVLNQISELTIAVSGGEDQLVERIMKYSGTPLAVAAGFQLGAFWTLNVYKANGEKGSRTLSLKAQMRSIPCEISLAKIWTENEGVVGRSLWEADEVIIDDLHDRNVQTIIGARPAANGLFRPDRSIVAVPILVPGYDLPWGIVCASSGEPNHFSRVPKQGLNTSDPIRTLAAHVGLAIAVFRSKTSCAGTETAIEVQN